MKMDKNKCCPGHIRQLCKSGRFKRSSCCCMVSLWQQADVYSSVWQVIKLVVWKIFLEKMHYCSILNLLTGIRQQKDFRCL